MINIIRIVVLFDNALFITTMRSDAVMLLPDRALHDEGQAQTMKVLI